MCILDSPDPTKGDVWLAVPQLQGKWSGRTPFPTNPGSDDGARSCQGTSDVEAREVPGHMTEIHMSPLQILTVAHMRIRSLREGMRSQHCSKQPWVTASLFCPSSLPLPSSKAISVINGNLESHIFAWPFWNQIVAIFHQPPNSNLFMVKRKDRPMW